MFKIFLEKISWNLDSWWKSLKDYFCIIDNSSLDYFGINMIGNMSIDI